ncbi:MAG: Glycosyltransferase [Parcubacteria bacterium C7867-006]|nr:MAG: Glycosyltransferase [Parcubacteria bacterium C7867-006]
MNILIAGTTGESMPPPYGGVPKLVLFYAGIWKEKGHNVAANFPYDSASGKRDDLGANAEYFFEYTKKPTNFDKGVFLLKHFLRSPILYTNLLVSYVRIAPKINKEVLLYAAYGVFIDGVFKKFKPDIVLGEGVLIKTYMASKIAKKWGVPIVFDSYAEVHDDSMGVNKWLINGGREKYWQTFLDLADFVITPGPYCSRGPLKYLPKEKVQYVYDGSDYGVLKFDIPNDKKVLRKSLNLPEDMFLLVSVGAFEYRKGHDLLIKTVAKLAKAGLNIGAVICGGSGDPEKWKTLAKEEGIPDRLFIFNRIPEIQLAKMYKSVDVYCELENTPRACGFTMAILEGMASSLPVIIFDNEDMMEAIQGGKSGFAVPMNDTVALYKAIYEMYNLSPEQRTIMGELNSKLAKSIDIRYTSLKKLELLEKVKKNYIKS